jgi:hypothetical protein
LAGALGGALLDHLHQSLGLTLLRVLDLFDDGHLDLLIHILALVSTFQQTNGLIGSSLYAHTILIGSSNHKLSHHFIVLQTGN